MKNKVIIPFVVILFLLFAGCKKNESDTPVKLKSEDLIGLKYGDNSIQSVDVYLPENRDNQTKMVVFIHGGFWVGGDKAELSELAKKFRDKGYACASVNYRLANTSENNIHPAQVNDLAKAIEFIETKATDWKIAKGSTALVGASAGGHLALLYTYAYDSANKVKTVVSLAGPTNLTDMQNASPQQAQVVKWFLGASAQSNPSIYQQASPISHVNANSKPTLLFHGKLDAVVPYAQSVSLKAKLDQFNVKNKLITYDNLGHEADLNAVSNFVAELESWLAIYLK